MTRGMRHLLSCRKKYTQRPRLVVVRFVSPKKRPMRGVFWEHQRCKIRRMKLRQELRQTSLSVCERETLKQVHAIQIANVTHNKDIRRHSNGPQDSVREEPFVEDNWEGMDLFMGVDEEGFSSTLGAVAEQDPPRASHELRLPLGQGVLSFLQMRVPRR